MTHLDDAPPQSLERASYRAGLSDGYVEGLKEAQTLVMSILELLQDQNDRVVLNDVIKKLQKLRTTPIESKDGNYTLQTKAKNLDAFIQGLFYQNDSESIKYEQVFPVQKA